MDKMNEIAINVENASVRFNMASEKVDNIKEYIIKIIKHELMYKEFLALEDINMKVHKGEAWGLIGTNGAGKSTLLKLICGILTPYKGSITVNGSIAPLIELGAGFDPSLTAGENIYLNGAILGYNKQFIREHYDEIVGFAELENFLSLPIKNYSSGMRARLGFAVATVVKPDILIVDEVLAVGDTAFQNKCNKRMNELLSDGTTLLFVSHSVPQVRALCDHALWLDHGHMRMFGEVNEVCTAYEKSMKVPVSQPAQKENAPHVQEKKADAPHYDYLVIGSGISGATFAYEMNRRGKKVLVLEKRPHIGGNLYTEDIGQIQVHRYGPHIFHTDSAAVWKYINGFTSFNHFVNSPMANYHGEMYNLPFNMNTFFQMWGITTPEEAKKKIKEQCEEISEAPNNLEQKAISMVGRDVYEKLIKGYTEKQWGRPCSELPSDIIMRLPVRFTYDNNYYDSKYQGIPENGYTAIIERMLEGCDVKLETDYLADAAHWNAMAERVVYTGQLDAFYQYQYGALEYRSLRLEQQTLDTPDFQGVAVVNYTDAQTPYTRIVEHKHFTECESEQTVITREYSQKWEQGREPFYPINDEMNMALYGQYAQLAEQEKNTLFLGRLARYKYLDMDKAVEEALELVNAELRRE